MTTHPERRKSDFSTPLSILFLGAVIGLLGWFGNDLLTQLRSSMIDLKTSSETHYEKLWGALSSSQIKVNCIQNQMAKCCKDSTYCT